MDYPQLVAAIVDSLAWPGTILVLLVVFRKEVIQLAPRLQSLGVGAFQVQFVNRLESLVEKVDDLDVKPAGPKPAMDAPPPGRGGNEAGAGKPETVVRRPSSGERPERLARVSPRAAVSESWLQVEEALRQVADRRGLSTSHSPKRLVRALTSEGALSLDEADLIEELRTLRNEAVTRRESELSTEAALEYVEVAARIRDQLST